MNRLIKNRNTKEIDEAGKIAKFYGFQPIIPPAVEKQDFEFTRTLDQSLCPEEKAVILRMYFDEKMMSYPQPVMFYFERPFPGLKRADSQRKRPSYLDCSLVSLGSARNVCECLSIQAAVSILNLIGYKNLEIEINSVGDKDSINEFQKKLLIFVRKNFNLFSAGLKQILKKDISAVFKGENKECENVQVECPKSIDFLSESSRLHFKEVVEFLEVIDIPYRINHRLIGDLNIGSETVFSIKDGDESLPDEKKELASGFRFNRLAKRIGCKKDLPAVVLNISAKLRRKLKKVKVKIVKPQFYLIQFGPEAKLKSFLILRELHKVGVSVVHSIAKDKLGSQISMAECAETPYIILIGQKEALENSVAIRNTLTRAQEIVPISNLSAEAKKLAPKHFA